MFVIPFKFNEKEFNIFIILEDENIQRMREYDPGEFNISSFTRNSIFEGMKLRDVIIGWGTRDDLVKVTKLIRKGDSIDALKWLSRGFRFRPDQGDSDNPPEKIASTIPFPRKRGV